MHVDPASIDLATLELVRQHHRFRGTAMVEFSALEWQWSQKAFRRLDLPLALHRLHTAGAVRLVEGPAGGFDVVLTPQGLRRLEPPPRALGARVRRVFDLCRIAYAAMRPGSDAPAARSRRRSLDTTTASR